MRIVCKVKYLRCRVIFLYSLSFHTSVYSLVFFCFLFCFFFNLFFFLTIRIHLSLLTSGQYLNTSQYSLADRTYKFIANSPQLRYLLPLNLMTSKGNFSSSHHIFDRVMHIHTNKNKRKCIQLHKFKVC